MKAFIKETGFVVASEVEEAKSFKTRLLGLMFRSSMAEGTALLLDPCKQVHTCFMRFDMDGLFLSDEGEVLLVVERMKPWRVTPIVWGAGRMLELPGGALAGRVKKGETVVLEK